MAKQGTALTRRVVGWSAGTSDTVDEQALLVPLAALVALDRDRRSSDRNLAPDLVVEAHGRTANSGDVVGERWAYVWRLSDIELADPSTCYLQAVDGGWAYLAAAPDDAMVQVVTPTLDAEGAREVASKAFALALPEIKIGHALDPPPFRFDAAPRLGESWRDQRPVVGDQAMALDPVSGDGIGHTLRAAILLGALIKNGARDQKIAKTTYQARLRQSFIAHLDIGERYYSRIAGAASWSSVVWDMRRRRLALQLEDDRKRHAAYVLDRTEISFPQAETEHIQTARQ